MTRKPPRQAESGKRPSENGQELKGAETAEYIASILRELRSLAQSAQLPFLAYLIDIAWEEAKAQTVKKGPGED